MSQLHAIAVNWLFDAAAELVKKSDSVEAAYRTDDCLRHTTMVAAAYREAAALLRLRAHEMDKKP